MNFLVSCWQYFCLKQLINLLYDCCYVILYSFFLALLCKPNKSLQFTNWLTIFQTFKRLLLFCQTLTYRWPTSTINECVHLLEAIGIKEPAKNLIWTQPFQNLAQAAEVRKKSHKIWHKLTTTMASTPKRSNKDPPLKQQFYKTKSSHTKKEPFISRRPMEPLTKSKSLLKKLIFFLGFIRFFFCQRVSQSFVE